MGRVLALSGHWTQAELARMFKVPPPAYRGSSGVTGSTVAGKIGGGPKARMMGRRVYVDRLPAIELTQRPCETMSVLSECWVVTVS
jgi:hypothetical protein